MGSHSKTLFVIKPRIVNCLIKTKPRSDGNLLSEEDEQHDNFRSDCAEWFGKKTTGIETEIWSLVLKNVDIYLELYFHMIKVMISSLNSNNAREQLEIFVF